ncbi:MAG: hypothetical protein AAF502_11160 [Bacteroidota bacterium]
MQTKIWTRPLHVEFKISLFIEIAFKPIENFGKTGFGMGSVEISRCNAVTVFGMIFRLTQFITIGIKVAFLIEDSRGTPEELYSSTLNQMKFVSNWFVIEVIKPMFGSRNGGELDRIRSLALMLKINGSLLKV